VAEAHRQERLAHVEQPGAEFTQVCDLWFVVLPWITGPRSYNDEVAILNAVGGVKSVDRHIKPGRPQKLCAHGGEGVLRINDDHFPSSQDRIRT
jgi:hypothetical protein